MIWYHNPDWWQAIGTIAAVSVAIYAIFKEVPRNLELKRKTFRDELNWKLYEKFCQHKSILVSSAIDLGAGLIHVGDLSIYLINGEQVPQDVWKEYILKLDEANKHFWSNIQSYWSEGEDYLQSHNKLIDMHKRTIAQYKSIDQKISAYISNDLRMIDLSKLDQNQVVALLKLSKEYSDQLESILEQVDGLKKEIYKQLIKPIMEEENGTE